MEQILVTFSDPGVKAFVERQVSSESYPHASAYLASLIDQDRKVKAKARLEAQLLEGLESESIPWMEEKHQEMMREFDARHGKDE